MSSPLLFFSGVDVRIDSHFFFNGLCFIAVLNHLRGQTIRDLANGSPFKLVPISCDDPIFFLHIYFEH